MGTRLMLSSTYCPHCGKELRWPVAGFVPVLKVLYWTLRVLGIVLLAVL